MEIVVVIPARYASTRFPGKPLAKIDGKPMICRVYESALQAENVSRVAVATDDERIVSAVEEVGGIALMTSEDNRSGTDRVAEVAEKMGLKPGDIVINVQGDQPLLNPRCLEDVIRPFLEPSPPRMSTLGFRIVDPKEITNPKDVKVTFDRNGNALYFSRSPIPFARDEGTLFDTYKHLGVYAYTRAFLDVFRNLRPSPLENIEKLEQLRALEYGYPIRVVITPFDSPEVDLPEDILRMEAILKMKNTGL